MGEYFKPVMTVTNINDKHIDVCQALTNSALELTSTMGMPFCIGHTKFFEEVAFADSRIMALSMATCLNQCQTKGTAILFNLIGSEAYNNENIDLWRHMYDLAEEDPTLLPSNNYAQPLLNDLIEEARITHNYNSKPEQLKTPAAQQKLNDELALVRDRIKYQVKKSHNMIVVSHNSKSFLDVLAGVFAPEVFCVDGRQVHPLSILVASKVDMSGHDLNINAMPKMFGSWLGHDLTFMTPTEFAESEFIHYENISLDLIA